MNESKPLEAEILPETQALVVTGKQGGEVGILRPADSLDRIADAFREYKRVCETILDKSDYQEYEGKPRKKKSAWRKLATAFNVSTCIVKEELERTESRHVLSASYTVCAYTGPKSAPYRQVEVVGYCDVNEKCCPSSRGEKCHKAAWKGHYCCSNGCDGRKHWTHPDHDVKSTAQTRASNRAIADLIGCGEVSAEELTDDGPKPEVNKPEPAKPAPPAKPVTTTKPTQSPGPKLKPPTAATRVWMIDQLTKAGLHDIAVEYFQKLDSPAVLMPKEGLSEVPLWSVPNCHQEMSALITKVKEFGNGDRAGHAFKPHLDADDPHPPKPAAESLPKAPVKDPEWWRDVIVPVPPKGSKRAEYMVNPDTLGSLFDKRHGNDEESQASRQRLWGFVNHYEAKPWVGKDGKERPPSDTDVKFREALDALADWFEKNHRGEKL